MNEQPLPPGLEPMPRAQEGACVECGGPVHPYEADLGIDDRGRLICGACNRARLRRIGPDKRAIRRQHSWRFGHDPADPEATESSPYEYVTLEQTEAPVTNQKSSLRGGPESVLPCLECGTLLRIVATASVLDLLGPLGYKPAPGTTPPKEKILVLICPKCERVTQWRESYYKRVVAQKRTGGRHAI